MAPLHLIQKRKCGLSSLSFPNCSFSETSLRLKLGAHFHLGMKSSGRYNQLLAMARARVSSSLPGMGGVPFQGRTSQGHISGLFSVKQKWASSHSVARRPIPRGREALAGWGLRTHTVKAAGRKTRSSYQHSVCLFPSPNPNINNNNKHKLRQSCSYTK